MTTTGEPLIANRAFLSEVQEFNSELVAWVDEKDRGISYSPVWGTKYTHDRTLHLGRLGSEVEMVAAPAFSKIAVPTAQKLLLSSAFTEQTYDQDEVEIADLQELRFDAHMHQWRTFRDGAQKTEAVWITIGEKSLGRINSIPIALGTLAVEDWINQQSSGNKQLLDIFRKSL